jgi:hypothetical protein
MVAIMLVGTESDSTEVARITWELPSAAAGRRLKAPWAQSTYDVLPLDPPRSAHRPQQSPDAAFELLLRREPESFRL